MLASSISDRWLCCHLELLLLIGGGSRWSKKVRQLLATADLVGRFFLFLSCARSSSSRQRSSFLAGVHSSGSFHELHWEVDVGSRLEGDPLASTLDDRLVCSAMFQNEGRRGEGIQEALAVSCRRRRSAEAVESPMVIKNWSC